MINDEEEEFLIADQFDSQQSEPTSCQISSSSNNPMSDSHSQDSQESHSNSTTHSKSKKRRYEYDLVETFQTEEELNMYMSDHCSEYGYSFTNSGIKGNKVHYHCKHSLYKKTPHRNNGMYAFYTKEGPISIFNNNEQHTFHNNIKKPSIGENEKAFILKMYDYGITTAGAIVRQMRKDNQIGEKNILNVLNFNEKRWTPLIEPTTNQLYNLLAGIRLSKFGCPTIGLETLNEWFRIRAN